MSADPLSFFAGDDSSSSDSEGGEEGGVGQPERLEEASQDPDRLPSPSTLFSTVKKPSFLSDPNDRLVDWDRFVKNDATDAENIHFGGGSGQYSAIAPPTDLVEEDSKHSKHVHSSLSAAIVRTYSNTGGEISAPPVRYSASEVDAKFRTVSNATSEGVGTGGESQGGRKEGLQGSKRAGSDLAAEEGDAKKLRAENFRQKEKRKRSLGQASRGTSYVEEEKRVLRQQFATDEVMN
jgi:hypothetical protein